MKKILITGARGFIGRNLAAHLGQRQNLDILLLDRETTAAMSAVYLEEADVVFHLAGVNRPKADEEFEAGNASYTAELCSSLAKRTKDVHIVMASSIQAGLDTAYGVSKLHAEEALHNLAANSNGTVAIFRLRNVFGKWCQPNYNSVTATFCNNIALGLPISISDPGVELDLVYVDDVVAALASEVDNPTESDSGLVQDTIPCHAITLGALAKQIQSFHAVHTSPQSPDLSLRFNRCLYATYMSYVPMDQLEYGLQIKTDSRGQLAEFIKSESLGQVFVSLTHPGVTRGNHYHHTKIEKFLVLTGEGLVRLRHLDSSEVAEYWVRGEDYRVVDIPPGYTHSIENVGTSDMTTLFWASEPFDPDRPDTYNAEVCRADADEQAPVHQAP